MSSSSLVIVVVVLVLCFVACCPSVALGGLGVDVATPITSSQFACLAQNFFDFVIVRAYHSYGAVDTNCPPTVKNAVAAGINTTDVYLFPCYGKAATGALPASVQVADTINYLNQTGTPYSRIWLDIEENPSTGCSWETDPALFSKNCDFLAALLQSGQQAGVKMGVYSSNWEWERIMTPCTAGQDVPLWYADWNDQLSFSDYAEFGGWQKPTLKQYGSTDGVCGLDEDADWY